MKKILLVDGCTDSRNQVSQALGEHYELELAASLAEARDQVARYPYDLVLLEADFTGEDAWGWCAELKREVKTREMPVIFLTRRSEVADKVNAFEHGADDYLVKPYESLELCSRVKVRLRGARVTDQERLIQRGILTLSVPYQKAVIQQGDSEKDLRLTPTEFRLLYFFIKHEGTVLSRDQLLTTIWSEDVHVLSRTIDKHISTLKKKLGDGSEYIHSVHSRGYKFSVHKKSVQKFSFPADPKSNLNFRSHWYLDCIVFFS
jgi:DNA-binding response OmpR family regulator